MTHHEIIERCTQHYGTPNFRRMLADDLGMSYRHTVRLCNGTAPISKPLEKLIKAITK